MINESDLLTWQLAYMRFVKGEQLPKKNKNIMLKTEAAGDLIVPDDVTIGELFDAISEQLKGSSPGNIDFYERC